MNEREFVKQKFAEYYRRNIRHIPSPVSLEKREFGFVIFEERIMVRHKGFRTEDNFRSYLASLAPSDAYYSSAYYERPEEPMEKKGWLGADLIFDIDADHIDTPCKSSHEYWICESCENAGTGAPPPKCAQCGGTKFKKEAWLCETCLEAAKAETLKLADFLINDFGFTPEELEFCFSGHRGYHACVYSPEVTHMDQAARKEIVDYVYGTGLKVEFHGFRDANKNTPDAVGPDLNDPGWSGRIVKGVYGLLSASTPQQLEQFPGIGKAGKTLAANRDTILDNWNTRPPWAAKGVSAKAWASIAQQVVKSQAANVDSVVTTDTHRLLRLPFSLHGKTGMMAAHIPADSLEGFDPLKEAIAFPEGTLKIHINGAHKFRIGDTQYGPYEGETLTLPMAAAVYLLCKRAAKLVQ